MSYSSPEDQIQQINYPVDTLPSRDSSRPRPESGYKARDASPSRPCTATLLWLTVLLNITTLNFLTSWIPRLAKSAGLALNLATYAGGKVDLGAVFSIATAAISRSLT